MLGKEAVLLVLGYAADAGGIGSGAQMGQRQVVQRGQVKGMGVADVQHLQAFAACQRSQILNIFAESNLQEFQFLAVCEGCQILDGRAGEDAVFQIGHARHKIAAIQPFVVSKVHETDILAVIQVLAVIIHQVIGAADHLRIRQGAAAAEFHTPNYLGLLPVVVPDLCQNIVGDLAVFQHEALAVLQQIQRQPDFCLALVADLGVLDVHLFIGGGDGGAKEIKAVVEDNLRCRFLQRLGILLAQLADFLTAGKIHIGQIGQQRQLFADFRHTVGGQVRQIQLCGLGIVLLAQNIHRTGDGDIGIGRPQFFHLFQRDLRGLQPDGLHIGQMDQVFRHGGKVVVADFQYQLGAVRGKGLAAQGHLVNHFQLRQPGLENLQNTIVPAFRRIHLLQSREILHQQFHVRFRQSGNGHGFGIIGELPALEGNVPCNLAVRQLGMDSIVMFNGNILFPQVQALGVDGIGRTLHKNMVIPVPHKADNTGHRQCKHQQNHHQHGYHCFLHNADLRFFFKLC